MGKNNKSNVRNIREMKNNPSIADDHVNGQSSSGSMESKKKSVKDADPETRSASKDVDQENDALASSLRNVRKSMKKRKKKIGHPIIVEDNAKEFPVVPLPLRHRATDNSVPIVVSPIIFDLRKNEKHEKSTKRASVTIAECIKPRSEKTSKEFGAPKVIQETMELASTEILASDELVASPLARGGSSGAKNSRKSESSLVRLAEKSIQSMEINEATSAKQLPRFYSFRKKVLVVMEPDCKFSFHGKLKIRALYGSARIYGYSLSAERTKLPLTVYAPRAYSPVAVEATDSEIFDKSPSALWKILGENCDDRKLAKRLESDAKSAEEGWAILMLENFDNRLTNFLAENFPHHLFPRIEDPSNHSWRDSRRAEIVLQANLHLDDSSRKIVIDSRGIDDVADAIAYDWETKKISRTVVAGGKGVGKSTLSRYLVNKFLATCKSIVFLDLDPGQAEFTPAGCVSLTIVDEPLLGPNFTNLRIPYYQLYVGSSDVTRCLTRYIDAIKKLIDRLGDDPRLSHRPIVVNTMGYCKGIGWDIMSYVIKIFTPTDVVQILSRRAKNNFDDSLSRQVIDRLNLGWMSWRNEASRDDKPTRHRLHIIYSEAETSTGPAESWSLEAHQQRELAMISYLSEIVEINEPTISQARGLSCINAATPYAISFVAMSVSLAGAFIPRVLSVMNGNIVALCGVDAESMEKSNIDDSATTSYPRVLIRPPLSTCYGFGILRGVDMEKEQLFVSASLPISLMRHVNCLVGCTNLPPSLMRLSQEGAPYTGSVYDLPTSREPRRGYFRTRYQADAVNS